MRVSTRFLMTTSMGGLIALVLVVGVSVHHAQNQSSGRPTIATEADFRRAMKELSNWDRWGNDDELGAANLITPAKRKQALNLAREGLAISMAHDVAQEKAADAANILERVVVNVSPTGATDRYQYTGTYHGVIHSHLDAVDCHIMSDGKGYNGRSMEDIKATPQGWLEPGTAIHREDLEALEKIERVKVSPGDVILLYTGRWKRRAALGPWPNATGFAGYHADVAYFLKERGVSFIGHDGPNDVSPTGFPQTVGLPIHQLALVAMGVSIFDNLDFERTAEEAKRLNRYEFLFMASPLRIDKGMGSPLNPLAIF